MGSAWDLHAKTTLMDEEEPSSKQQDMKEEKSPACRMDGESEQECVSRKTAELVDEGMERDQAVATAYSMCEEACSEKEEAAPMKKDVEKLMEAHDMLMAAGALIKQSIEEYGGYTPDEDEVVEMAAPKSEEKAAELLAISRLIEQQAEQTRATRQLVDSLTDLTKSIHRGNNDGTSSGGLVSEPDAAQPDVVEDEGDRLEGILENRLRGFADGIRRDLSKTNNLKRNSNV